MEVALYDIATGKQLISCESAANFGVESSDASQEKWRKSTDIPFERRFTNVSNLLHRAMTRYKGGEYPDVISQVRA